MLELAALNDFMQAKINLTEMCGIEESNATLDFFGDETTGFTRFLKFLLDYDIQSNCSSEFCQSKNLSQAASVIPQMNTGDGASASLFTTAIIGWLVGSFDAPCLRPLEKPLPKRRFIHWDKNSLT